MTVAEESFDAYCTRNGFDPSHPAVWQRFLDDLEGITDPSLGEGEKK